MSRWLAGAANTYQPPITTNKKAFTAEGVCNNRTDNLPDPP
ncbi:hypothetical protein ACSF6U_08685 [Escherichia coli]